ncbi:hypothetical protein EJ05DRAFT_512584 [Pseudovirgaria hyperparasitica]|uniref:Uncharacterized protein n=1 Tax=Pseudovirgaria hyperparasitica TaxID=470096 RepID=A0A6A6W1Y1_9PEZI|nr:uncharacterized protein EJ05DRAFT_512584 [Pseudovirgaria hyperparasitica]KAF2756014.1 hypothetical protein EJ05DRAFT_512584 [Pseudovirgaria hyperparasitica]
MPMNWDTATEAKLFSLLLRESKLSLSADILKRIATEMGPECTPKAITHRIAKLRALGATAGDGTPPDANSSAPATPKKTRAKKAPATPKSAKGKRSKSVVDEDDEEVKEEVDEAELDHGSESPKKKSKRAGVKKEAPVSDAEEDV